MVSSWSRIRVNLVLATVISVIIFGLFVRNVDGQSIEKSGNLSRFSEVGRKIRMFIKNRYLQTFENGIVNATDNDTSDYTILQRISFDTGQVKILGIATSTFLCMDRCGLLYSTQDFNDDCVFNEQLEENFYNIYTSVKYSDANITSYLAISKKGRPKKVQIMTNSALGKFTSFVEVLPVPVEQQRIEELEKKLESNHPRQRRHRHRHHHHKIKNSAKCQKREDE